MQLLAARSPSPERAPGKQAGSAKRAVNIVRTFPGLPEVAADLASQQPLAAPSPSPETQPPRPLVVGARGGLGKPEVGGMLLINARAALAATPPPPASPERVGTSPPAGPGEVNRRAKTAAPHARSKADSINARSKARTAGAEAALGSAAPQPQAPQARTQGGDDDGEDVFYWLYRRPRKRGRPHDDAKPRPPPRKRGRPKAGARPKAGPAPSFLQEPLPAVKQPPLPPPSVQPPPSLHPLPRSDLWTIVDMHALG
jgi:hypothetical protein